ncbi:hypothetical protein [Vibrio ouci]|uniref:Type 4 fimbrial biogenesis protein PilX N-terminal domain-containing protein n=1 Tax=Vibrio ouci TaxID=2499078 RepID=A0A4Y8WI76_9VIBR|nr:hypothetical protein [Vibrio ouci]TFH91961.1 hypothetical protein ELS82_09530 [Vibrio ouci]
MRGVHQRGVVTLMVVSILLAAALMLSLSSYKSVFYQIKRAQNELKDRQAHWQVEGGIECLYAYISAEPSQLNMLSSAANILLDDICKTDLNLTELYSYPIGTDRYVIRAKSDSHAITKQFLYAAKTGLGAIQTTADLRIRGSAEISPDVPRSKNSAGTYDCIAVRYKHQVSYQTTTSSDQLITRDPSAGAPYSVFNGECANTHKTTNSVSSNTSVDIGLFKQDYKQDTGLEPFKNYFGLDKTFSNLAEVKSHYQVVSLATVVDGHDCADVIQTHSNAGVQKLWIEGHCIIDSPVIIHGAYSLVVENGLFAAHGSMVFEGSIYHMVDMTSSEFSLANIASYWNDVSFKAAIQSYLGPTTVYFDNGAFKPKGGMMFDAEGAEVVLNGSYSIDYSSANSLSNPPKVLTSLAGSWNVE